MNWPVCWSVSTRWKLEDKIYHEENSSVSRFYLWIDQYAGRFQQISFSRKTFFQFKRITAPFKHAILTEIWTRDSWIRTKCTLVSYSAIQGKNYFPLVHTKQSLICYLEEIYIYIYIKYVLRWSISFGLWPINVQSRTKSMLKRKKVTKVTLFMSSLESRLTAWDENCARNFRYLRILRIIISK